MRHCMDKQEWAYHTTYQSPPIINEHIEIITMSVIRSVLKPINTAQYYAILADETCDCSNREQLVICLRWVSENYDVFENPVGLYEPPNTMAATLKSTILDSIIRVGLSINRTPSTI